jgi:hypothetical protein
VCKEQEQKAANMRSSVQHCFFQSFSGAYLSVVFTMSFITPTTGRCCFWLIISFLWRSTLSVCPETIAQICLKQQFKVAPFLIALTHLTKVPHLSGRATSVKSTKTRGLLPSIRLLMTGESWPCCGLLLNYRVSQNRNYTVYDCMPGDYSAKNTVYTPKCEGINEDRSRV